MMYHEKYMQQTLLEVQKALSKNEVPIGAVIVSNNRVIARGYNQTIVSSVFQPFLFILFFQYSKQRL